MPDLSFDVCGPPVCEQCGAYCTADVAYRGRRCVCEGSPLCVAFAGLCESCPHLSGMDCDPGRCARVIMGAN